MRHHYPDNQVEGTRTTRTNRRVGQLALPLDRSLWRGPDELTRLNEKSLVLSSQGGNARAFESIYRRYSKLVYSICLRMLRDPDDAQEAAQETFLRVHRALPEFNGSYRLRPWICRIARNICLDRTRFTTKRTNVSESVDPIVLEATPDPSTEPERVLMHRFEGTQLRAHLEDLPSQYKSVLLLRDLDGLSYADIADKLSISESQVKNFLHRGRKKLRQSLLVNRIALLAPLGFLRLRWHKLFHSQSATTTVAPQESLSSSLIGTVASSTPQLVSASQAIAATCHPASERIVAAVGAAVVGLGIAGGPATSLTPKLERPAVHRVVESTPSVPGHSAGPKVRGEYFNPPVPDQSPNQDERVASVATRDEAAEFATQESTTEPVAGEEESISIPAEEVSAPPDGETSSDHNDEVAEVPTEVPSDEGDAPATGEPPAAVDTPPDAPATGEEPTEIPADEGGVPTTGDAAGDELATGESPADTGSEQPIEVPADNALTGGAPDAAGGLVDTSSNQVLDRT